LSCKVTYKSSIIPFGADNIHESIKIHPKKFKSKKIWFKNISHYLILFSLVLEVNIASYGFFCKKS
jgi:hypothetical protein